MGFSKDFLWGAATAAAQVEGAWDEDGKAPGIWDCLCEGHVKHGETPHEADDFYHRWREDIRIMKEAGLNSFRFSVSWPRIITDGKGTVNEKGLAFYSDLTDGLLAAGIEPLVTLYHWDLPMWAHETGGWKDPALPDRFAHYVKTVSDALSDRVTFWMTMNEPQCFIGLGYGYGQHAPFERADAKTLAAIERNVMLAHGKAVSVLRKHAKRTPKIGFAMSDAPVVPADDSPEAFEQAYQKTVFTSSSLFWQEGMILGNFTGDLAGIVTEEDRRIIVQPLDFYGTNCYQARNYIDFPGMVNPAVTPGLPRTATDWVVCPEALYYLPQYLYRRYRLPVLVTENGMANCDVVSLDGKVHDPQRIDFLHRYLRELKKAAEAGVPVLGCQVWSLLDNFEWAEGYDKRFGLVYVDYKTQRRIPKDSLAWYASVIRDNGETL